MKTILTSAMLLASGFALAGPIGSGGPPIKLEATCKNTDLNLTLTVSRSAMDGLRVYGDGPFGRIEKLAVTKSFASGQPVSYDGESFHLSIALTAGPIRPEGTAVRPGKIMYHPGNALFSASVVCTIYPN